MSVHKFTRFVRFYSWVSTSCQMWEFSGRFNSHVADFFKSTHYRYMPFVENNLRVLLEKTAPWLSNCQEYSHIPNKKPAQRKNLTHLWVVEDSINSVHKTCSDNKGFQRRTCFSVSRRRRSQTTGFVQRRETRPLRWSCGAVRWERSPRCSLG